ncbi:MAG: ATPase domain-containing protein, partial [Ilumatobacteraceae bacterium]
MAKTRIEHVCTECGTAHPKWAGQCAACGQWNTLVEEFSSGDVPVIAPAASMAKPIGDIDPLTSRPRPTGIGELDRVLGGGVVPGSVTLLGGEPGIGKSTLLLQLLAAWPGKALYVTAEESAQQVRLRAERLDAVRPDLWLLAETALPHILAA